MTEQRPPVRRPIPAALVVARRAMVVAAAAMVIAALAVVVALLGEPGTDSAETAAVEQARDDAASAQDEADAATDMADAAIVIAEEAAAVAAAAQAALADALASAGETVDPETIARLEAQLEEARNLAATALVAADAAAATAGATGDDAAPEDGTESGQVSEPEEAAATDEDAAEPDDGAAATDEDEPEPDDTAATDEGASEPDDTGAAAALPGEPSEIGPSAGTGLAVVGIRHDSALNFRDVPSGTVIARLDNVMDGVRDPAVYARQPGSDDIITTVDLQNGVVATGNTRQLPTTIWHELQVGDLLGWASSTYLAQAGGTDDATSEVVDTLGELPVADTMVELGLAVARTMASQEPQSNVVVSGAPGLSGDLGQVTIDIVGIGDDSVRGYRLVVFAHPAENWTPDNPGPFTLKSVERTVLCHSHRGASADGVCS